MVFSVWLINSLSRYQAFVVEMQLVQETVLSLLLNDSIGEAGGPNTVIGPTVAVVLDSP
jgi:hypothetical protein